MSEKTIHDRELDLLMEATRTDDPARLWEIVGELNEYSLYESANSVAGKAREKQQEQDAAAWRRMKS